METQDVRAEEAGGAAGEAAADAEPRSAQETGPADPAAARAEEYLQSLQRLKADFDNYRRRMAADQARWAESALAGFILKVLPVLDNLERAFAATGDADAVRQGVELTVRELREVLSAVGVRPMESVGQPFDPARHEAVARGPAPGVADGAVAEEYRRGYLLRDLVLRPAMVRVAEAGPATEAAPEARQEGEPS